MPVTATDTDTFPSTVQRPSNGEVADSASLAQPVDALTKRTRYAYNRSASGIFDVTRAPFNADITGTADSTTAIQTAIAAAASAGGVVWFPAGIYLHTGLTVPEGVDLEFAPRAYLAMSHATADHLTFTGASTYLPNLVLGARFVGNVFGTGSAVRVATAGARVLLRGCSFNSASDVILLGRFGRVDSVGGKLRFEDCLCYVVGTQRAYEASGGGAIEVVGGILKMPAAYSTQLMYVNNGSRGDLDGVSIDCTAHNSGTASILVADSASDAAMVNCKINAVGMSGNTTGFAWSTAARVKALGNEWRISGAMTIYGSSLAAAGSELELLPYYTGSNGGNSYTVANGHRSVAVYNSAGVTAPTFDLPFAYVAGQELDLTIYNLSGVTWGFGLSGVGFKATQPTLFNNTGATARFVAQDPTNTSVPSWVQIGGWATVSP